MADESTKVGIISRQMLCGTAIGIADDHELEALYKVHFSTDMLYVHSAMTQMPEA